MHDPERTFFFVHVMKTGGTTFAQHIDSNFERPHRYPLADPGIHRQEEYYLIARILDLTPRQRVGIRLYAGHFPFVVSSMVGADVTLTILRDPIERTVSFLRHCKRYQESMREMPLEEIYDDGWMYPLYIHNYQAKLFAMGRGDKLESHLDVIDVDDARLETAMSNLEHVEVLGLSDHYSEFVEEVQHRYGWNIGPAPNMRVSTEDWDVSAPFRARIADDNAADMAFYERATQIHARRRNAR